MADVENNNNEKSESKAGDAGSSAAAASADAFRSEIWAAPKSDTQRADAYSSDTQRGNAYRSDTQRADAYPSDTARGDAYPSDTARGDAYPSDTARGDVFPTPTMTKDGGKEAGAKDQGKVAGDKDQGKEPGDKEDSERARILREMSNSNPHPDGKYDPFFQNDKMMQSRMEPLDAAQGDKPQEVVGGDRYTYDENGVETYTNAGGAQVITNPDGSTSIRGDVVSHTQSKDGNDQTIIFADGSRVYLQGGRIRAVSSERDNAKTPYSRYREIYRSNYK